MVCSTAHPSIFLPAITLHCVKMGSWPWVIFHHFPCLCCVFVLWNSKPLHIVSFAALLISQSGHYLSQDGGEGSFFPRSKHYTAATQVKYEEWFSLPIFSGAFSSIFLLSVLFYFIFSFFLGLWQLFMYRIVILEFGALARRTFLIVKNVIIGIFTRC